MSVLLETGDVSATQWILLGLILVLIILYPVFTVFKNKKEKEKFDGLASSLKVSDKVMTSSGVYGEIVAITEQAQGKLITLKTGDEAHVGYVGVDIYAIYTVFKDPEEVETAEMTAQETPAEEVREEIPSQAEEKPKPKSKSKKK